SVGIHSSHAIAKFRSHGPGAANCKPGTNDRFQKSLPTGTRCTVALCLRLLKGVVDGKRECWMRQFCKAAHGLRHTIEKERLRPLLAAMAVRRRDQLFSF